MKWLKSKAAAYSQIDADRRKISIPSEKVSGVNLLSRHSSVNYLSTFNSRAHTERVVFVFLTTAMIKRSQNCGIELHNRAELQFIYILCELHCILPCAWKKSLHTHHGYHCHGSIGIYVLLWCSCSHFPRGWTDTHTAAQLKGNWFGWSGVSCCQNTSVIVCSQATPLLTNQHLQAWLEVASEYFTITLKPSVRQSKQRCGPKHTSEPIVERIKKTFFTDPISTLSKMFGLRLKISCVRENQHF